MARRRKDVQPRMLHIGSARLWWDADCLGVRMLWIGKGDLRHRLSVRHQAARILLGLNNLTTTDAGKDTIRPRLIAIVTGLQHA